MPRITPFLWFDNNLEQALSFYPTVFGETEILNVTRAGEDGPIFTASFRIEGQEFHAINGGPHHSFSEAISFSIDCQNQAEVDYYWEKLSEGGEQGQCGWLRDRFGLSWQVAPNMLPTLLAGDGDPQRANRVLQTMLQMTKLDVTKLQAAFDAE